MKTQLLISLLLLGKLCAQVLPDPPPAEEEFCSNVISDERLDCHPEPNASTEVCGLRGCCWNSNVENGPYCFFPSNFDPHTITFNDNGTFFLERNYKSPYPNDILTVEAVSSLLLNGVNRITLKDVSNERFVPPYPQLNIKREPPKRDDFEFKKEKAVLNITVNHSKGLVIAVRLENLMFSDQFSQISFILDGTLYGVGEHRTRLALDDNWTKYTLWNHDVGPRENTNLYGSHPFILAMSDLGVPTGIYLHNSNAMEIVLQPGPTVTFRILGGIFDFFFFTGDTPADVIRQYVQLTGLPRLPPFWGLGFQLCRWGYNSAKNTREVWQRNRDAKIPFDVQWNDIDYMERHNDFTVDPVNFADLAELVDDIHAAGMHYVSMLDPGISGSEAAGSYPPYDDGVAMDTLIKDKNGNIFIGHVWNDADTVYPDFFHPNVSIYWKKQLREFRDKIEFDALWIDMNEPSNFFNGLENGCPNDTLENPPYVPPVDGDILQTKTLCMTAQHAAGSHYNLHNLFAISEADVTIKAAEEIIGKRTFLISRASSSGLGRYSGHWAGDNYSGWSEMAASIVELLSFSLFGVPFMGSDICGFGGTASKELCNRWMQLGAFYPFSRNHNSIDNPDQDPASFDEEFINSSRGVLSLRYDLLPYLYTLFYYATTRGDTVARPLFFEFPYDRLARKIDTAFMWGPALYIVPVLNESATSVDAYLPKARWFNFYTLGKEQSEWGDVTLDAPFNVINVFVRGGYIIPMVSARETTTESRKHPFYFTIAPNENGTAEGSLFWDDGESLYTLDSGEYGLLFFEFTGQNFTSSVIQWKTAEKPIASRAIFLGITDYPSKVLVNGEEVAYQYSDITKNLAVEIPQLPINEDITISLLP